MGSTEEIDKFRSGTKKKIEASSKESEKGEDKIVEPPVKEESSLESADSAQPESSIPSKPKISDLSPKLNIQATRVRNDSESSENDKSPSSDRMKRQRTVGDSSPVQNFIFPGMAASPPKFMTLDEVMKATEGVSNMVLAHEIAVDKNFKLEKFDPPDNSVEKQIRDVMHKAFWDNLEEQLAEDPPCYKQAFVLLEEVRDTLLEITLPHQEHLRQEINETLDLDLIKQQACNNSLDFYQYSQYVLSVMARLCAPVRDEAIQNLRSETSVTKVFKGVLELLDLMQLDMANFTIQQIRPHIIAQSVDYEKKKFKEFLKTQNDGLEFTRNWIIGHIQPEELNVTDEFEIRSIISKVMSRAYLDLLTWPTEKLFPETVLLDGSRLIELRDRFIQVCMLGAILLVTMSTINPTRNVDTFKAKLKKNLCSILDPAFSEKETHESMENVAEQVIKDTNDYLAEVDQPQLALSAKNALKSQILEIKKPDHRVCSLIVKRALEFIGIILNSTTPRPVQVPPGLSTMQEELAHICGTLLRLVSHNRAVFGEFYADIIRTHIKGSAVCTDN